MHVDPQCATAGVMQIHHSKKWIRAVDQMLLCTIPMTKLRECKMRALSTFAKALRRGGRVLQGRCQSTNFNAARST